MGVDVLLRHSSQDKSAILYLSSLSLPALML
jgi:hypothetical protein